MNNRYMDRIEAYSAEMKYDEFVQYCILMLQEEDHFIERVWQEDSAIFIRSYDTKALDDGMLVSVIPAEHGPAVTKQDVFAAHPAYLQSDYTVDIHSYRDMDDRSCAFYFFADAEITRVPPTLREKKAAVDSVLLPLRYEYQINRKKAGAADDGTIGYFADNIRFFYEWCAEHRDLKHFRNCYRYCTHQKVEIWNADSLRGDYESQKIVSKAVRYLCEADCAVEIGLWDMDSGFEILWLNIRGLIERGKVKLIRKCAR